MTHHLLVPLTRWGELPDSYVSKDLGFGTSCLTGVLQGARRLLGVWDVPCPEGAGRSKDHSSDHGEGRRCPWPGFELWRQADLGFKKKILFRFFSLMKTI